jgi:redox-sensitive bicupin YhaK (pirin superfamily)
MNIKPRHEQFIYQPDEKLNKPLLALPPDKRENSAFIDQDAFLSLLKSEKDKTVNCKVNAEPNGVYIHIAEGKVIVKNELINEGNAIGIYETEEVKLTSHEDAELIIEEVPIPRGIKI